MIAAARCCALATIAAAMLAGCAIAPSSTAPQAVTPSAGGSLPASHGSGNIFWNKTHLRLPSKGHAEAILSYWGVDGYFTEPNYCRNGGQFTAMVHRSWGSPKKYLHVLYWFKAKSSGPDQCAFTAVLNNTGSPPIAIIHLTIK